MPTYPSISPLPPAPDPDSPATFNALAYPFTAALQTLVDEINAFSDAFEILISDAQYEALQIPGVNGQLLLPTLTGSGAAAATTLSPAMRAALALAGVASANRIPMLTGTGTATLASVSATGLAILGAASEAIARGAIDAPWIPASGRWISGQINASESLTLPAGGQWAYSYDEYAAPANTIAGTRRSGIATGGSTIFTAASGRIFMYSAWRIS